MKKILEITHPENQPSNAILAYGVVDISLGDNIKIEFGKGELGAYHQIELTFKSEVGDAYLRINTVGSGGMVKEGAIRDFLDGESVNYIRTSLAELKCAPGLKGIKMTISKN